MKLVVLYANENATNNNDASIVLKMTYNKISFLLMGDASVEIEDALMATTNMTATVLKAGHHGSNTSSSAKFISNVKPKVGILSYGKDNSYGHPHASIPTRLKNVGAKVYETAKHCNIIVKTDGVKHTVTTDCKKTTAAPASIKTIKPASTPIKTKKPAPKPIRTNFKNCTELRTVYPVGVAKGHAAYQSKMDRDKDGWACE
ncbi:MAG: excalibur calcium-binding domain-containing protein [Psychrobacillus psychrodurans]